MENDSRLEDAIEHLAALLEGNSRRPGPAHFRSKGEVIGFLKDAAIPGHTPDEAYELLLEEGFIVIES